MPPATVALVDNDATILGLMDELLTGEGYRTLRWSGGDGCFAMLKRTMPDAIILDVWMEERLTGLALLEQIAGDPATRHIAVIVCSGDKATLDTNAACLGALHCAVLAKPFDIGELLETVRAATQQATEHWAITAHGG